MRWFSLAVVLALVGSAARGQALGLPDRGEPGDEMIQAYLARLTKEVEVRFPDGLKTADDWTKLRPGYVDEYFYMLGLSPRPERSPLHATVTGRVEGEGFVVEKLHYQSRPGLYVTANLYRPAHETEGERLPALLYVSGHSAMGRNGNKTAFQSHGIWFARHGYVCLILDSLQLGEIEGVHHGTYRENRFWWHSRGYTPAGVECWNGIRGLDYLVSRPDVDADRLGLTGISGGGAATYWIAAADERIKVAVPVSGMADLESYVINRTVNGHCDCMFLDNTFQWPWTRIAGLIAPRPLLFVNSDSDSIFPMDANERVIARLERLYSLFGAGERVDAVVSVGGHDYRKDIRQAAYRFLNTYLQGDSRPVDDSEIDIADHPYPIAPERLRVFASEAEFPADRRNATIDREFVPKAQVELPSEGDFPAWKNRLMKELRRVTFRAFPDRVPPARAVGDEKDGVVRLETEEGIVVPLRQVKQVKKEGKGFNRVLLIISKGGAGQNLDGDDDPVPVFVLQPRGVGATRWTTRNPPNYVERAHVLLGRTVDEGRIHDIAATARYLRAKFGKPVTVMENRSAGLLGAYAALLEPEIDGVIAYSPPASHMADESPRLLNVLRVLDVPEALGMLAPRSLILDGADPTLADRVSKIYERAGAKGKMNAY